MSQTDISTATASGEAATVSPQIVDDSAQVKSLRTELQEMTMKLNEISISFTAYKLKTSKDVAELESKV